LVVHHPAHLQSALAHLQSVFTWFENRNDGLAIGDDSGRPAVIFDAVPVTAP